MTYKVWMKSTPGFYAQYDGSISVFAESEDEAIEEAFKKLKRNSFPDRSRDMWKIEKVECVGDDK